MDFHMMHVVTGSRLILPDNFSSSLLGGNRLLNSFISEMLCDAKIQLQFSARFCRIRISGTRKRLPIRSEVFQVESGTWSGALNRHLKYGLALKIQR